jgi:hypothetical protein
MAVSAALAEVHLEAGRGEVLRMPPLLHAGRVAPDVEDGSRRRVEDPAKDELLGIGWRGDGTHGFLGGMGKASPAKLSRRARRRSKRNALEERRGAEAPLAVGTGSVDQSVSRSQASRTAALARSQVRRDLPLNFLPVARQFRLDLVEVAAVAVVASERFHAVDVRRPEVVVDVVGADEWRSTEVSRAVRVLGGEVGLSAWHWPWWLLCS